MKIIDTFCFFNELTLLDLRLNILNQYVDEFVLVESTKSHQNYDKPLFYQENKHLFENFNHKINHIVVDEFPPHSYWAYEIFQRDSIIRGLDASSDDDIIFVSDLDEIWDPNKIVPSLNHLDYTTIKKWKSNICYFYFNMIADTNPWYQPFYMRYGFLKSLLNSGFTLSVDVLRNQLNRLPVDYEFGEEIEGWHFSYTEDVEYKLKNFLHQEYRNMTKEQIEDCIRNRINPFHRNKMTVIEKEELKNYLPQYVFDNIEKYDRFIV